MITTTARLLGCGSPGVDVGDRLHQVPPAGRELGKVLEALACFGEDVLDGRVELERPLEQGKQGFKGIHMVEDLSQGSQSMNQSVSGHPIIRCPATLTSTQLLLPRVDTRATLTTMGLLRGSHSALGKACECLEPAPCAIVPS